jgi:hypothetical protein
VVEEASAVLPGASYMTLHSDHLKLNKFASKREGNYVSVSSNLARIAAQAPQLVNARLQRQCRITADIISTFY